MQHNKEDNPIITKVTSALSVDLLALRDVLSRKNIKRSRREVIQTHILKMIASYYYCVIGEDNRILPGYVNVCEKPALELIMLAFKHPEFDNKLAKDHPSPRFTNKVWSAVEHMDLLFPSTDATVFKRYINMLLNTHG